MLARNIDWMGGPQGPIVAGDEVVFARGCHGTIGEVLAVPKTGGSMRTLAMDQNGCGGLATGESRVFWTVQHHGGKKPAAGAVVRVMSAPLSGGDAAVFLSLQGCCEGPIAADGAGLVLRDPDSKRGLTAVGYDGKRATAITPASIPGFGHGIAIDETSVYYQEQDLHESVVKKAPRSGGASVVLVTEPSHSEIIDINALAVDATQVYYAFSERGVAHTGGLRAVGKNGGSAHTIAEGRVADVACDSNGVYWVDGGSESEPDGRLMRKAAGAAIEVLADQLAAPCGLALDVHSVYVLECGTLLDPARRSVDRNPGSVLRIDKPG